jgi:hypothetical protein
MENFLNSALGGYPRTGQDPSGMRQLYAFSGEGYGDAAPWPGTADSACAGAAFHSPSPGTSVASATDATVPPLPGSPYHSSAAGDTVAQMTAHTPSAGTHGGGDVEAMNVALASCVIVSHALVGPREVLSPGRSSLEEDGLYPLRGAFIISLLIRTPLSPLHVPPSLHPPKARAYPPNAWPPPTHAGQGQSRPPGWVNVWPPPSTLA